jgi:hexosaminidase
MLPSVNPQLKMNIKYQAIVASICLTTSLALSEDQRVPGIIPRPATLNRLDGFFTLETSTRIIADASSVATAEALAVRLRNSTGYPLTIGSAGGTEAIDGAILLTTGNSAGLGPEAYQLSVAPKAILIRASDQAGLFYGAQTLLQLLPPQIFSTHAIQGISWQLPCVRIEDQPRFKWRGLMLDVSRHFFTKTEVEQLLDAMALEKLNTFHWHLVDDQGWRIEIKKYPLLTQLGAWRDATHFGMDPKASTTYGPDGRYGGFYTQADIREVVAYAQARHINIVPEIEMPGHSSGALMAYPQFACNSGPFTTDHDGGVFNGIYCPGNDASFGFVEDVLSEVFELFPCKYIHVGGDEVPSTNWENCEKCQARMKAEGLTKAAELEGYFIRRVEKFITAHGRTLVGWSEIRTGGLGPTAVVMDWVGGAVESAQEGHDVVMTPLDDCYFDHYQSTDQAAEPHTIGGYLPLSRVYAYNPIPTNLPPALEGHILGLQANVWTEYMPNFAHVEYMVFPRLSALAEVAWSPASARNWNDFLQRLKIQEQRFDQIGISYRHDKRVIE